MIATGYALRAAINQLELRKDAVNRVFEDSLKVFPGEEKPNPKQLIEEYLDIEVSIAKLQTAQGAYNQRVTFGFEGRTITLCEAVKSIGGYSRVEKLWRFAAGGGKKDHYDNYGTERDTTKIYSAPAVTAREGVEYATAAAKRASILRASIAAANATEIDLDISPELLK